MYVKMLDGPFSGEVRDLRGDVALEHLRTGRATRAFADPEMPAPPAAAETVREPEAAPPAKKGKRSR